MAQEPLAEQDSLLPELFPPAPRRGEYLVPFGAVVEHCRSCNAEIVWARTARGKAISLSCKTIVTRDGQRYAKTHFADCPHSREWRRGV